MQFLDATTKISFSIVDLFIYSKGQRIWVWVEWKANSLFSTIEIDVVNQWEVNILSGVMRKSEKAIVMEHVKSGIELMDKTAV